MNFAPNLLRRYNNYHTFTRRINHIKSHFTTKKVLFGSGILLGLTTPTLISDDFAKYGLETHSGHKNAKEMFNDKYKNLLRMHQQQPLLYGMIGVNLLIYGMWKIRPTFMHKHFLCNLENMKSKRYYVLLTSNWSHMDFWHVGLNMYVLYNFGSIMITTIGIPSFSCIYIGSGILGSIGSLSWHILSSAPHYSSLGASASLLGIITAFAMYEPTARFKIILSPDSLSFSAMNGILGLIIFDSLGIIFKWRFLDHAAHLNGALFGFLSWQLIKQIYGTNDGELCINGKYIFDGKYLNYKINPDYNYGLIHSPTKTYNGEMLKNKFVFDGKGCLRNELNGSVFYGYFNNGFIDGLGLLCLNNDQIYPAIYDSSTKDFIIPNNFDPKQLEDILNNKISVLSVKNSELDLKLSNDHSGIDIKNNDNTDNTDNDTDILEIDKLIKKIVNDEGTNPSSGL